MADKLNERQRAFVEAFAGKAKGNATEAARLAGYTGSDAVLAVTGHDLLNLPKVSVEIKKLSDKVRTKAHATVSEIKATLTALMRDDPEMSEHELEFSVSGAPTIDPRKLTPEMRDFYGEHGRLPDDAGDVYFRRRTNKRERIAAANMLAKMSGALIDNIQLKMEGDLRSTIKRLKQHMKPESYADLIAAVGKLSAEIDDAQ